MPKGGTKRKLSELEDEGAVTREQENKEDDGETLKTPRQGTSPIFCKKSSNA